MCPRAGLQTARVFFSVPLVAWSAVSLGAAGVFAAAPVPFARKGGDIRPFFWNTVIKQKQKSDTALDSVYHIAIWYTI